MPPAKKSRPAVKTTAGPLKPLRLRDVPGSSARAAAARRPLRPTKVSATTSHARSHVPRSAQS